MKEVQTSLTAEVQGLKKPKWTSYLILRNFKTGYIHVVRSEASVRMTSGRRRGCHVWRLQIRLRGSK